MLAESSHAVSCSLQNMDAQVGLRLFARLFRARVRHVGLSGRLEINVIRAPNYALPLPRGGPRLIFNAKLDGVVHTSCIFICRCLDSSVFACNFMNFFIRVGYILCIFVMKFLHKQIVKRNVLHTHTKVIYIICINVELFLCFYTPTYFQHLLDYSLNSFS